MNRFLERFSQNQLVFLMIGLFALSALLFFLDRDVPLPVVYRPQSAASFTLLNSWDDVDLVYPPAMGEQTAVLVGSLPTGSTPQVIGLDTITGQERWRIDTDVQSRPSYWPDELGWSWPFSWAWGAVAVVDNVAVFGDSFALTTSLTAVDVATGERVWQRQLGAVNGSDVTFLDIEEGLVVARSDAGSYTEFYLFEPDTGRGRWQQREEADGMFWIDLDKPYRRLFAQPLGVEATGRDVWQRPLPGCGTNAHLLGELIVVTVKICEQPGAYQLVVLDRQTGGVQWQFPTPIISNVAFDGSLLLVLAADSRLLQIDAQSGTILAELAFLPKVVQIDGETPYFVGAGDGQTAVYFGDNHQLMLFQAN